MSITQLQLEERRVRGEQIANMKGQIKKTEQNYRVQSQSGNGFYTVTPTATGFYCSCPDFVQRGAEKCKHIFAVEFSQNLHEAVRVEREKKPTIIEEFNASTCLHCGSPNLKKSGIRHNRESEIQRFKCLDCSRTFSVNLGFEYMKHNPKAITSAMQLYFNGESLRNTAESLRLIGSKVSHQTIHNWIARYTASMSKYLDKIVPNVGDTWRADELYVKFKGNMKYVFAMMDDETRFWIAQEVAQSKEKADASGLFKNGKEAMGKNPKVLITDGLPAYRKACRDVFWTHKLGTRTRHIREIRLDGQRGVHNNKMERLNGEIRDREKVMRGLKVEDTPILKGYQIFHNYIRPHEALGGKTPADMAGITVQGENKWRTLIENASLSNRKLTEQGSNH